MDNKAVDLIDVRVNVKGEHVTVVFYLKDVPEKLTFSKQGVPEHRAEYTWEICIDVDNNKMTGDRSVSVIDPGGIDYCLDAVKWKSQDAPYEAAIEDEVQVAVWEVSSTGGERYSDGTIAIDVENNTIVLSGDIPGVNPSSLFYYRTDEVLDHSNSQGDSGPLFDRVTFEN